jgi:hypothetical protein
MYINLTCIQVMMCSMYFSLLCSTLLIDGTEVLFPTFGRDMTHMDNTFIIQSNIDIWINRRLLLFALVR